MHIQEHAACFPFRSQNFSKEVRRKSRRGENIFKRKDGRWEARYIHHYENGQAKYRFLYGRTYAEAKEKRQEEMRLLPREPAVRSRCQFLELGNLWLESIRVSVKESTYTR